MAQYNFSTLNDKDLEVLTRDLLTRELAIPFQSFKVGKDKGIDLRYSTANSENEIIVQVKHFLLSGYNKLLNVLKTVEKSKIERLSPKRYILVTSIGLNPMEKEKIKNILAPYILSTNDIFGCDDLNSLLTKYEDIEKQNYKLWFSGVTVLQKILNNGIHGRSAYAEEKIKKNIGLYVVNQSYEDALEVLRTQKILLITGIPGIGKTSLANLITYNLLSRDFRLIYIDEKIRDAEDVFDIDPNSKQLFFFDDFLGSNYLEIINPRNTENTIVNFIDRVKSSKNKYLILTTRSTILNQAVTVHEKIKRANLDSLKYEIEIRHYSQYDKAKILYNHLYFNNLDTDKVNEIFNNKNYWKIIKHNNYNPRLIEYFTKEQNIAHLKTGEYFDFIISNLDNPEEIWASALANQLNTPEKYLLFTLLSLGRFVSKSNLETAYEAKIEHEVLKCGFVREINQFAISFRNLLGGYITNSFFTEYGGNSYVDFVNPSLRDFLISFFNKNSNEKFRLIESFTFIEQFLLVFKRKPLAKNNIVIEDFELRKFLELACSNTITSVFCKDGSVNLRKTKLLFDYRYENSEEFVDRLILNCLNEIVWERISIYFFDDLMPLIEGVEVDNCIYDYFKTNFDIIIEKLTDRAHKSSEIERVKKVFEKFDINFFSYRNDDDKWKEKMISTIARVFKEEADSIIENSVSKIFSEDDFSNLENEISTTFEYLKVNYLVDIDVEQSYNPCESLNSESLIESNIKADIDDDSDDWKFEKEYVMETQEIVDDLFSTIER